MKVFNRLIYYKNQVFKMPNCLETGSAFIPKVRIMTGRKLEDDSENVPSKKLCTENDIDKEVKPVAEKIRKRNAALLLAYSGTQYMGMQKNPGFKTVESELLGALIKAKCIPDNSLEDMTAIHFQRAARTDKGVSAAKQVVSFKIAENFNIETINSYLPDDIIVLSIKRVTKGFNCKNDCVGRTYSYTLPSFALSPELHTEYPKGFRITEEMMIKAKNALYSFLGTKRFHNFTSKKNYNDPSSNRFIMSFDAEEPFIRNDEEFVTLKVKGQSFMMHQIRKMVGYTISILKGTAPSYLETDVWKEQKFSVPMAPSLGLVLENIHYDRYNRKFGNDGMHETLTWDEIEEEVEKFKQKHILNNIIQKELEEKVMFNWIQTLPFHTYSFSEEKALQEARAEENPSEDVEETVKTENRI